MTKQQSRVAVKRILEVTGKSQKQLAEDIGEDAGVVRQWTMSPPRKVPSEYRKRIAAFYGAVWDENGNMNQAGGGRRRFTRKSFENWRNSMIEMHKDKCGFPADTKNVEGYLRGKATDVLMRTLRAAEGRGNSRRLFAVVESFLHWSHGIVEDFKLSDAKEIQDVYRDKTKSGVLKSTGRTKYIPILQSVIR